MQYIKNYKLFEKISVPDEDVDFIYDKFFKKDIDEIEKTGKVNPSMFRENRDAGTTDLFISQKCKQAHKINPCMIKINTDMSYYNFETKVIAFSISGNALAHVVYFNGDIDEAAAFLPKHQKEPFRNNFKEYRIKGTIAHEIAHWLDDSFNNNHLSKNIPKFRKKQKYKNDSNITLLSLIEIEGQINNIKQMKREYSDLWDNMSFNSLIEHIPSFAGIYKKLNLNQLEQWKQLIKKRMNREGLLGKQMR